MKKFIVLFLLVGSVSLAAQRVSAGVYFSAGFSVPVPVVVAPPVYVAAAPVYVAPPVVYSAPVYHGYYGGYPGYCGPAIVRYNRDFAHRYWHYRPYHYGGHYRCGW